MMNTFGYIYIRNHESYDNYNVIKLGMTDNIPDRDTQYSTSEIKKGVFEIVYEVDKKQLRIIENLLHSNFCKFNYRIDGGKEFFDKKIINDIEPYFNKIGIKYKKLSKEEIYGLSRRDRVKKTEATCPFLMI